MNYQHKYYVTLVVAVISGTVVTEAALKIHGSMGDPALISTGAWQLAVSIVVFAISAPAVFYYNARRKMPITKEELEINILLAKNKNKKH